MFFASMITSGDVNQAGSDRRSCSEGRLAGWPCKRLNTKIIVSSPHSVGGLEEEVILVRLHDIWVFVRRSGSDYKLCSKNLVPTCRSARAYQDAIRYPVQSYPTAQAE